MTPHEAQRAVAFVVFVYANQGRIPSNLSDKNPDPGQSKTEFKFRDGKYVNSLAQGYDQDTSSLIQADMSQQRTYVQFDGTTTKLELTRQGSDSFRFEDQENRITYQVNVRSSQVIFENSSTSARKQFELS